MHDPGGYSADSVQDGLAEDAAPEPSRGAVQSAHDDRGLSLYGIFTLLLVLALRDGELSTLYPIISLTYVWVTFLSVWLFGESMNPFKALGVATIVFGVALLGKGGKK